MARTTVNYNDDLIAKMKAAISDMPPPAEKAKREAKGHAWAMQQLADYIGEQVFVKQHTVRAVYDTLVNKGVAMMSFSTFKLHWSKLQADQRAKWVKGSKRPKPAAKAKKAPASSPTASAPLTNAQAENLADTQANNSEHNRIDTQADNAHNLNNQQANAQARSTANDFVRDPGDDL